MKKQLTIQGLDKFELISLLNLATGKLSRDRDFVKYVVKLYDPAELVKIEHDCFETNLPATVALPESARQNSVILTAALYLATQKRDLSRKNKEIFCKAFAKAHGDEPMKRSQELGKYNYRPEGFRNYLYSVPEIAAIIMWVHLAVIYDDVQPNSIPNMWKGYQNFIHNDETAPDAQVYDFVRERNDTIGVKKTFSEYYWDFGEVATARYEKAQQFLDPIGIIERSMFSGGVSLDPILLNSNSVSKSDAVNAAASVAVSQIGQNQFGLDEYKKAYIENPSTRDNFNGAFLLSIASRKIAQFYSRNILAELKEKMFGKKDNQKEVERRINKVQKSEENLRKLENENKTLRSKISSDDSWKDSAKKREYALKDKIAKLQKQLEEQNALIEDIRNREILESETEEITEEPDVEIEETLEKGDVDYRETLKNYTEKHKILVAGGHPNLVKKLGTLYPDMILVGNRDAANCDGAVKGADFAFMYSASCSHKLYWKVRDIAQGSDISFTYLPATTNIKNIEKTICLAIESNLRREEQ